MSSRTSLQLGTWMSLGSAAVAELASEIGFDWLLFDLEHGCEAEAALPAQLRALRGSATNGIVRVGAPHPDLIGRVLDWGARGIMVPHVENAAEAMHCVKAAHYPPKGRRGYSRTVRACRYGLEAPDTSSSPLLLAQIETAAAVDQADAIAAVAGIDVLFVGPADLGYDLQIQNSSRSFDECLQTVAEAAASHGKAAGILVRGDADLSKLQQLGFTWIALNSDLSLLREGFQRNLQSGRNLSGQGGAQ